MWADMLKSTGARKRGPPNDNQSENAANRASLKRGTGGLRVKPANEEGTRGRGRSERSRGMSKGKENERGRSNNRCPCATDAATTTRGEERAKQDEDPKRNLGREKDEPQQEGTARKEATKGSSIAIAPAIATTILTRTMAVSAVMVTKILMLVLEP